MSSEPPAETSLVQDEGLAAKSREQSGNGMRGRWRSITTVIGVLAVAGGIAAFLFLSSGPDPRDGPAAAVKGLACPHLRQAAQAYERSDRAAFEREIALAAATAEETLQKSGEIFGKPERIALELALGDGQGTSKLLAQARTSCSAVDR